jgi:DMSO reductase anchor subunit
MHPAASIIFFTVASGTGYGMLAWLGLHTLSQPPEPVRGLTVLLVALALVSAGLLSSTFHLGHPERAWRALSQWRSSWLSREGVAAIATYPPALLFGAALLFPGDLSGLLEPAGLVMAVLALVTVFCTSMIYASLKPIPAWHNGLTVALYFAYAAATGLLLFAALVHAMGARPPFLVAPLVVACVVCWAVLRLYWRRVDGPAETPTKARAIGLDASQVRPLDPPHTEANYLQREMGFQIARKHAAKFRRISEAVGLAVPIILILAVQVLPPWAASLALIAAALAAIFGALVQRWLFFAEAKHMVMLYYDRDAAYT